METIRRAVRPKWILLDADGVLQAPERPFVAALDQIAGEAARAWLADTFRGDGLVITGKREALPALEDFLHSVHAEADSREVYARLWERVTLHDDVFALVDSWRASGRRVALTTNQDPGRARYMRSVLNFDERFDRSYYSCDIGAGKPSARYFEHVLADLRIRPDEAVFIDDVETNVASARALGIEAHRWQHGDELTALARYVKASPDDSLIATPS
ncbi:HAD family hydrolase [Curtobacterium oceanosedimentum]|uniref:HAD family hydrolase n=1 Tax=Curtobacterium oceanosedimentum TaxID=465820 RepID=UPI0007363A07|nr:HAD-IA family hydrolase [Curtobacterium oceanosedimentum]